MRTGGVGVWEEPARDRWQDVGWSGAGQCPQRPHLRRRPDLHRQEQVPLLSYHGGRCVSSATLVKDRFSPKSWKLPTHRFGQPIEVEGYVDDFLRDPKPTVKRLTQKMVEVMRSVTANAPDWCASRLVLLNCELICVQYGVVADVRTGTRGGRPKRRGACSGPKRPPSHSATSATSPRGARVGSIVKNGRFLRERERKGCLTFSRRRESRRSKRRSRAPCSSTERRLRLPTCPMPRLGPSCCPRTSTRPSGSRPQHAFPPSSPSSRAHSRL